MQKLNSKGFTLIELLIVIAIIAIIAGAVFVALNPLQRFADSRDARRWSDVASILSAVKLNQVDNKGTYLAAIMAAASNTPLMISDGAGSNCTTGCTATATTACVDLGGLKTSGQMGSIPVSPAESTTWTSNNSGYYLRRASSTGAITIGACEVGNLGATISVIR